MKKNIIYVCLALFALAIIVFSNTAKNESSIAASSGQLTFSNEVFDFGTVVMKAGNVSHKFELKNEGEEPIIITKAYTSCGCTTAFIQNKDETVGPFGMQGHLGMVLDTNIKIEPGESAFVDAIFDPAAHGPAGVGQIRRVVYVETNSSAHPKIELNFQALVTN